MKIYAFALFCILGLCAQSQSEKQTIILDTVYQNKLDSLLKEDQRVRGRKFTKASRQRRKLIDKKHTNRYIRANALMKEWYAVDSSNIYHLLELITERGYPSRKIVGGQGYVSGVTIILHFDRDTGNKLLRPILDEALQDDLIDPRDYATIIDRHFYVHGDQQQYFEYQFCDFLDLSESEKEKVLENRHKIGLNKFSFKCSTFGKIVTIE